MRETERRNHGVGIHTVYGTDGEFPDTQYNGICAGAICGGELMKNCLRLICQLR